MSYLPPEIWMMVIDLVECQEDIARLCRVSRQLNALCTPILYEEPTPSPTTEAFFRTLVESPHLAWQVKTFSNEFEDFDNFSMKWKDLSPATMDLFNFHFRALSRVERNMPDGHPRSLTTKLLNSIMDKGRRIPDAFCQSVLMSLLPNLQEAPLRVLGTTFLPSIPSDALAKLKKITITEDSSGLTEFVFANARFLAEAATNLESLSFSDLTFDMNQYPVGDCKFSKFQPFQTFYMFPTVTNLSIVGLGFSGLETSAWDFVLSFPLLQSFRFDGMRQVESPSQPKIMSLLRTLSRHAPRLKHFCLGGAISVDVEDRRAPGLASEWRQTLKVLSQLRFLETLSIDTDSLWPIEDEDEERVDIPQNLFLNCLPQSLHHLHIYDDDDEGTWYFRGIRIRDLTKSFLKLSQAMSTDEKFNCLKLISFSVQDSDEDFAEVMGAMGESGAQLVRQDGPWDSDGLYGGD